VAAQVPVTLQFPRSAHFNARLIHYQWTDADEQAWKSAFADRMDKMGLAAQLSSATLAGLGEEQFLFFFREGAPASIECLVTIESVAPGESIQLIDIATRQVVFDFKMQREKRVMTPAFDPASVKLVWTSALPGSRNSRFSIPSIYYASTGSRMPDIGFGASLACHPNAICKTDSMDVLISNSAVRIRVVAEEGAGYCTGAMLNNTRLDKTPYVLTAFHCQWNATPIYDQWRFDFDYVSPTCPNPDTEPDIFSLHGCELISGGQGSDYLLVKINQEIPGKQVGTRMMSILLTRLITFIIRKQTFANSPLQQRRPLYIPMSLHGPRAIQLPVIITSGLNLRKAGMNLVRQAGLYLTRMDS
jgi:hypothetical protein